MDIFLFCLLYQLSDFPCVQVFAPINFARAAFSFGLSWYINDWIAAQGVSNCFYVCGGIVLGVCLLAIPQYIYGKRIRSYVYRHHLID